MDLSEAMKIALAKSHSAQQAAAAAAAAVAGNNGSSSSTAHGSSGDHSGAGYVTEKLYMLLQLYLQNKGWNPSVELLQCFAELKDTPVLPNAAYLQMLASRVALDAQGRLVLRDSGKIILPFEHFANAVMLKHMSGPHGLHLSVEATVRAVMDSYTIGRENLGMEKEFIVEVVQSCPSPACRYYKGQIGVGPFIDQTFNPGNHLNPEYLAHLQQLGQSGLDIGSVDAVAGKALNNQAKISKTASTQQQQITAAIIQQQNRAMAQQSLEKFGNLSNIEKQRVLQQLDKKHYEVAQAQVTGMQSQLVSATSSTNALSSAQSSAQSQQASVAAAAAALLQQQQQQQQQQTQSLEVTRSQQITQQAHVVQQPIQQQQTQQQTPPLVNNAQTVSSQVATTPSYLSQPPLQTINMDTGHKLSDYMRGAVDPLENVSTSKDLLALHNGAWSLERGGAGAGPDGLAISQDKIIRAFSELMRNIARMKTCIRPSMCKPYGKQSETLQKTLFDTIQLIQSLRNCLPAPHIPVTSWKSETHTGPNGTESG
ncbi:uncharacterized protein LOC129747633 [Uranotaenia lowii]|uniref:uncharacterized protein LOC129747633 n=1 Tax=Uranotaenia lowii TaxID=190385 RepID=UPI002478335B|nr:uncharacterized protein LOC129747633 [Uranotaenia lowii]